MLFVEFQALMSESSCGLAINRHLFNTEAEYYRNHSYSILNLISKRTEMIMNIEGSRKIRVRNDIREENKMKPRVNYK